MSLHRRGFGWSVLGLATLILAGCANTEQAPKAADPGKLQISDMKFTFAPGFVMNWPQGERDYRAQLPPKRGAKGKAAKPPSDAAVLDAPDAQAYLRNQLAEVVSTKLQERVLPVFQSGTRAAVIEVEFFEFSVPEAALGAGRLGAVTRLRDSKTGAEIAQLDLAKAGAAGSGWLGDGAAPSAVSQDGGATDAYVGAIERWLKPPT
jgi:hypothetical protein